jgi:hypothetical protein
MTPWLRLVPILRLGSRLMRSQRSPRRMALSPGADQMNLPVRAAFDRIEADVIALCRVHRATVHMARTSERAAANRRMMRWRSATLTRDSSEKRAVNISVPVSAPVTPARPSAQCSPARMQPPRAPVNATQDHAGVSPHIGQPNGSHAAHARLRSPRPDWDVSAPAKRRCRRPRYITPDLLPATVAPW